MTMRGTPFLFEGQEIGMTNGDFAGLDEVMDIESHNIYAMATRLGIPKSIRWKMIRRTSRDNARTPMQWTGGDNAGFTSGTPWLKTNANHTAVNVEQEMADPDGVLAFWKKMIAKRKNCPILTEGSFQVIHEGKQIYAFERAWKGQKLLSICNMSGKNAPLPDFVGDWDRTVLSNYPKINRAYLKPFEFRLMKQKGDKT